METVLVCGVGAFGQAVIARLLPFWVPLRLIDLSVLSLLRPHQAKAQAVPSSGTLLAVGDQLVVLASLPALRRVELACCQPEGWVLTLQLPQPLSKELRLTIQQCLVRHLGISPLQITDQLAWGTILRFPVDPDNGALVVRDLRHQGIQVDIRARLNEGEIEPAEALEWGQSAERGADSGSAPGVHAPH